MTLHVLPASFASNIPNFVFQKNPLTLSAQVSWPLADRVECEIGSQFLPALAV